MIGKFQFDSNSYKYEQNQKYNQMFLSTELRYLRDLYEKQGYLYFETIYQILGIPWDPYNENMCWIYKRDGLLSFSAVKDLKNDSWICRIRPEEVK